MTLRPIFVLRFTLSAFLAGSIVLSPLAASAEPPRYVMRKDHDPDGIGKFFMGREIAQVMGPGGVLWLERNSRADEERPDLLMEALNVKRGDTVVDLGAGSGYYTFRLAAAVGPRGTVLAADIEPKMLALIKQRAASRNLTQIGLIRNTDRDPRLPANRIDLVLLVDVYHELSFPVEMMQKVRASLKRDGRVALVEYRGEDPLVAIKPLHKMTEAQIIAELTAIGFKHVQTVHTLPLQHIVIFGK